MTTKITTFIDSEKVRLDAYYNVTHVLAHISEADMTVCQDVVDAVMDAVKDNLSTVFCTDCNGTGRNQRGKCVSCGGRGER